MVNTFSAFISATTHHIAFILELRTHLTDPQTSLVNCNAQRWLCLRRGTPHSQCITYLLLYSTLLYSTLLYTICSSLSHSTLIYSTLLCSACSTLLYSTLLLVDQKESINSQVALSAIRFNGDTYSCMHGCSTLYTLLSTILYNLLILHSSLLYSILYSTPLHSKLATNVVLLFCSCHLFNLTLQNFTAELFGPTGLY